MRLKFDILTLHPEMVRVPLSTSIIGRAQQAGRLEVAVHDIREQAQDRHRSVDDTPYGGGAGMVMKVDVVAAALEQVRRPESLVLLTTPTGRPLKQSDCERWATHSHLVILTGHYEGIDARIETLVDERVSLGDFVLTGGEFAAVAIVDAVGRLVDGVLGNSHSAAEESFHNGLLEYPQYTRPKVWNGLAVPEILLSGHHARIRAWRHEQSVAITRARRPDLWEEYQRQVDAEPLSD